MIYLHEKQLSENRIRHWANEKRLSTQEDYEVATYKIKQIETDIIYNDAVDVLPCIYTYETTEEIIPIEIPNVEEQ